MFRSTVAAALLGAGFYLATFPCAGQTVAIKEPYYLPAHPANFGAALISPPKANSPQQMADIEAVHQAEQVRTPEAIAQARADDAEEDIFVYASVLGPRFNAVDLPRTAALSRHLRNDVGVVSPPLKAKYNRARPFLADANLHPVCEMKKEGSYPSGHAAVGYLTGLVLAQMLPDHADAILDRADSYARNRIVCGVHYPTDLAASRTLALIMLGQIVTSTRFQQDSNAARQEILHHLHEERNQQ